MLNPLVSVIMPSYNCAIYLKDSISSVLNQVYTNWELIIADNCSTDNSREIINRYCASDSRIKFIGCEYNSGSPARPRNIGINNAKGKYVCFLDADDLWMEDKLQKQIEYLEAHNDVFMLYGRYKILKNGTILKNNIKPDSRGMKAGRIFHDLFLSDNFIPCVTVMFRNQYDENYLFDEDPRSMEDFDLWLRISKKEKVAFLDEPLAIYRLHDTSTTASIKVFLLKYRTLLRKWQKEIPPGIMFLRYMLLIFQISVMVMRKIKDKTLAKVGMHA